MLSQLLSCINSCNSLTVFLSIIYRGSFKKGLFHGKGAHKYNNGDIYDGEYVDGKVILLNTLSSIFVNSISREYLSIWCEIVDNSISVNS